MIFAFRCRECLTPCDYMCARKDVPTEVACEACGGTAGRDWSTVTVRGDDPFRKSWLSDGLSQKLSEQQRPLDPLAPKDKFEAKHVQEATGRIYIGDDISKLKPSSQAAIIKGQAAKGIAIG